MKTRYNILQTAWTSKPIMLDGRELIFTPGKYELLKSLENRLFIDHNTDQTENHAIHEVVYFCFKDEEEQFELLEMSKEARHKAVIVFMMKYAKQLPEIVDEIVLRINAAKLSAAESEGGGKQEGQAQIPTG
jgi:hypothetical protein